MADEKYQVLSAEQVRALNSLLAGDTIQEAAEAAGVHERTVYRWIKTVEFQAAFEEQRSAIIQRGKLRLSKMMEQALDALDDCSVPIYPHRLRRNSRSTLNPQTVRISSAKEILDRLGLTAPKTTEQQPEEFDEAALEEALRARGWVKQDDPKDGDS